jgi:hypothetical protein
MSRKTLLIALVSAGVAAVAAYYRYWGAIALIAVLLGGYGWMRWRATREPATEQFFEDMGEETRMTHIQGGSPSEMPVDGEPRDLKAPH